MYLNLLAPNPEVFKLHWKEYGFEQGFELPKITQDIPGVYIFWWIGPKEELEKLSRKIILKGKVLKKNELTGSNINHVFHRLEYQTSWFPELETKRFALYVGKSTGIHGRFSLHRYRKELNDWIIPGFTENYKDSNLHVPIHKPTTASQFRSGWESLVRHLSRDEANDLLKKHIVFSYLPIDQDEGVVNRFYLEDYLIGTLRPWFNLDSER